MMVRFLFLVRLIYKAIFSEEMKGNSDEQLSKFKMLLIKTTLVLAKDSSSPMSSCAELESVHG